MTVKAFLVILWIILLGIAVYQKQWSIATLYSGLVYLATEEYTHD